MNESRIYPFHREINEKDKGDPKACRPSSCEDGSLWVSTGSGLLTPPHHRDRALPL